jgi:hypothetical protein
MRKIEIDGSVSERMEFPIALKKTFEKLFIAASVNRIFFLEDLKEFIFRSMLHFPELEIDKNYFEKGYLFKVSKDNKVDTVGLDDINSLIGIDFSGSLPYKSRKYWFEKMEDSYKDALMKSFFRNLPSDENEIAAYLNTNAYKTECNFSNFKKPDEVAVANAEKFSSFIVSKIDTNIFTALNASQREYIGQRLENFPMITEDKKYPDFDFELVSESTREAIIEKILTILPPKKETIIRENIYHFTKFIWIVANDFYDIDPEEQVIFDRKYNCDDEYTSDIIDEILGYYNLTDYYNWGFDELHVLLKGLYKAV